MYQAVEQAVETGLSALTSYAWASEASIDLADELAWALEQMILAVAEHDPDDSMTRAVLDRLHEMRWIAWRRSYEASTPDQVPESGPATQVLRTDRDR